MFLCDKCHDDCKTDHLSRSRGRCEGCGETKSCVDCRKHHEEPPASAPAESAESVRSAVLACFRRTVRLAHVTQDVAQRTVFQIRVEGMREMALAAGLTEQDLDIITLEMSAASLGRKL